MALEKTAFFLSVFALVCGQAAPHGSDTPLLSSLLPGFPQQLSLGPCSQATFSSHCNCQPSLLLVFL